MRGGKLGEDPCERCSRLRLPGLELRAGTVGIRAVVDKGDDALLVWLERQVAAWPLLRLAAGDLDASGNPVSASGCCAPSAPSAGST